MPEYNIVLLGESGAGKSLMINSIPVYLKHKTLFDAIDASDIPCLIPVSFTVTDDDFEEVQVEFGGTSSNENHVTGESCTLKCISYEFKCDNSLVRLIDTPGVMSTQGRDQDILNMEHILETIGHYRDIHAIAIVLKSNQTKLTPQFKSCLNIILTHLHSSATANLIFILTHSESTDYKPGSIMPIIKKHFNEMKKTSVSKADIVLNRNNIFCVDNKGFRFLAIRQTKSCNVDPTPSYFSSYVQSANEFGRMLKYVIGDRSGPGLSPHQTVNTMSINQARQFIQIVNPFLKEIIEQIDKYQNNINGYEQERRALDDAINKNRDYCIKEKQLDQCSLVEKEWFCKSETCRKYIVVNENEVHSYFPRICSKPSKLNRKLTKTCGSCGCDVSDHKKMSSLTKVKEIEKINESKQSAFNTASSTKSKVEEDISALAAKMTHLREESAFIQSVIPMFEKFYTAHAIVLTDDEKRDTTVSVYENELQIDEVNSYKTRLFQLSVYGPKIKYKYDWKIINYRQAMCESRVGDANQYKLAERFPQYRFC